MVVTDSGLSLADGKLLTRIWKTTVISEPEEVPPPPVELVEAPSTTSLPSGDIVNPDGSRGK